GRRPSATDPGPWKSAVACWRSSLESPPRSRPPSPRPRPQPCGWPPRGVAAPRSSSARRRAGPQLPPPPSASSRRPPTGTRLRRGVEQVPALVHELEIGAVAKIDPGEEPPDAVELVHTLEHADRAGALLGAKRHRVVHGDRRRSGVDHGIALRDTFGERPAPQRVVRVPEPLRDAGGDDDEPVAL